MGRNIRMIVRIMSANGGWMTIPEIRDAIYAQYGHPIPYNSIHSSLNNTGLAEHVQKNLGTKPQQYKFEG